MNKRPTFFRPRHRVECMVVHLRVCGSHGQSRTRDGRCVHRIGGETACRAHSQCETAALSFRNTVRGKALTLVRSAEKHHGLAAWERIKTEYLPDAAGRHTAMLMEIMQLGWDSRGAANTFLDQSTEWERRVQEHEGESLETFSDGMKIAVLASHAPESFRNMVRLAAGPAESIEWCDRTCQSFSSSPGSSTRMVEVWSRNPAVRV